MEKRRQAGEHAGMRQLPLLALRRRHAGPHRYFGGATRWRWRLKIPLRHHAWREQCAGGREDKPRCDSALQKNRTGGSDMKSKPPVSVMQCGALRPAAGKNPKNSRSAALVPSG